MQLNINASCKYSYCTRMRCKSGLRGESCDGAKTVMHWGLTSLDPRGRNSKVASVRWRWKPLLAGIAFHTEDQHDTSRGAPGQLHPRTWLAQTKLMLVDITPCVAWRILQPKPQEDALRSRRIRKPREVQSVVFHKDALQQDEKTWDLPTSLISQRKQREMVK